MPELGEIRHQNGIPQFYLPPREAESLARAVGARWRKGAWVSVHPPGSVPFHKRAWLIWVPEDIYQQLCSLPERTRIDWQAMWNHRQLIIIAHAIDDLTFEALLQEADAMGGSHA